MTYPPCSDGTIKRMQRELPYTRDDAENSVSPFAQRAREVQYARCRRTTDKRRCTPCSESCCSGWTRNSAIIWSFPCCARFPVFPALAGCCADKRLRCRSRSWGSNSPIPSVLPPASTKTPTWRRCSRISASGFWSSAPSRRARNRATRKAAAVPPATTPRAAQPHGLQQRRRGAVSE